MENEKKITIPKGIIDKEGGVVILTLREYQRLCARAAPTCYPEGIESEEMAELLKNWII